MSAQMRVPKAALSLVCAALTLALSACGGSGSGSSGTDGGVPAGSGTGGRTSASAQSGRQLFDNVGCAGCHTLAAAGSDGHVGPDLDTLKPSYAAVVHQVTDGGGGMPAFGSSLTKAEIHAVARFVSRAAR